MKSLTNLREAFLVFAALTVIAFANVGQLWERQKISLRYMNWELTQMLALNPAQIQKINSINTLYETEISMLVDEDPEAQKKDSSRLLRERNNRIMEVLNEEQQKILSTYCTDLISLSKIIE